MWINIRQGMLILNMAVGGLGVCSLGKMKLTLRLLLVTSEDHNHTKMINYNIMVIFSKSGVGNPQVPPPPTTHTHTHTHTQYSLVYNNMLIRLVCLIYWYTRLYLWVKYMFTVMLYHQIIGYYNSLSS